MTNPNFSEQISQISLLWSILKEKRNTQWFTTNSTQFLSEITFKTIRETNSRSRNRVYQFSQRRLLFEQLNRNCHQISTNIHLGRSRIECKWISKQNLICIMTQKQNIINQIEAHWFLRKSIFQKFSFHIQIRIMIKYFL